MEALHLPLFFIQEESVPSNWLKEVKNKTVFKLSKVNIASPLIISCLCYGSLYKCMFIKRNQDP